jgi:hypothetical protein
MHFPVVFLPVLLFLGLVIAAPTPGEGGHDNHWWGNQKCLTDQEASDIAEAFEGFYGVFDMAQAESLIADDFQSISDSNGNFYPDFVVRHSPPKSAAAYSPALRHLPSRSSDTRRLVLSA